MTSPLCPICSSSTRPVAELLVLDRHQHALLACEACQHAFFDAPDWLDEAYEQSIASTDVGLVDRSLRLANVVTAFLSRYPGAGPALDFAAGTGLMVRILRDRGFDFRYFDAYGPNHLAEGFEVTAEPPERYQLVTAIEVAEHLVDPLATFEKLAELTDTIMFTTQLTPGGREPSQDWPYLSLETGQHVSFYTHASLRALAERLDMSIVSRGDMHLLSRRSVSPLAWRAITTSSVGHLLTLGRRKHSLLGADHARAVAQRRQPTA